MLSQSCVVYQKTSVSLEEAYNSGRAKVKLINREPIYYEYIYLQDNIYYGKLALTRKGTPLYAHQISSIYLKDFKKSELQTIFLVLGIIVMPPLIIYGLISLD